MSEILTPEIQCFIFCALSVLIYAVAQVGLDNLVDSIPDDFLYKIVTRLEGFYKSVKNYINQIKPKGD